MPKPRFQACSFLLSTNKVVAGQQTQPACTLEIRHNGRYLLLKKQLCDVKGLHRGFIPYAQVSCTPIGRIVSAAGPRPGPWRLYGEKSILLSFHKQQPDVDQCVRV